MSRVSAKLVLVSAVVVAGMSIGEAAKSKDNAGKASAPGAIEFETPASPPASWLTYHLVHPGLRSGAGDPNCAFYWKGRYHLHYIYTNHDGVLCDNNGENGLRIAVVRESTTLRVGTVHAPFELKKGEDLALRVFIDKNLVEVFVNNRQAAAAAIKFAPENLGASLFSKGGNVMVKEVEGWKMKTIYADM